MSGLATRQRLQHLVRRRGPAGDRPCAQIIPLLSVRRHVVPDGGYIRGLDRRLVDHQTITHHQDAVG